MLRMAGKASRTGAPQSWAQDMQGRRWALCASECGRTVRSPDARVRRGAARGHVAGAGE